VTASNSLDFLCRLAGSNSSYRAVADNCLMDEGEGVAAAKWPMSSSRLAETRCQDSTPLAAGTPACDAMIARSQMVLGLG
jgi:hypothetical protein